MRPQSWELCKTGCNVGVEASASANKNQIVLDIKSSLVQTDRRRTSQPVLAVVVGRNDRVGLCVQANTGQ